jgi:hypothetical protein
MSGNRQELRLPVAGIEFDRLAAATLASPPLFDISIASPALSEF